MDSNTERLKREPFSKSYHLESQTRFLSNSKLYELLVLISKHHFFFFLLSFP